MKSSEKKLLVVEIITLVILILDIFVTNILNDYLLALFLLLIFGIIVFLTGYTRNRHLYTKDILLNIFIYCFLYYIIIYLSGIFIGFLKTSYNLSLIGIIKNIMPIIINIIACELLRYMFISKCGKNKFLLIFTCLLCTFIDVKLIAYAYDLSTLAGIIKIGYMSFLPLFSKNILMTYLCYKFGYVPNCIYRFFMEIPIYILPIVPNINEYFDTIIDLLFPAIILYLTYREFKNEKKQIKSRTSNRLQNMLSVIVIIFILLVVSLTSGIFKYYSLAIGSNSMANSINKGDVVIVEKLSLEEVKSLDVGDVLVYKHNDVVIVHRIVRITHINNNYYFNTKGDNNNNEDSWTIEQSSVIGRAKIRIPYVGIPTVWLNEKV